VAGVIWCDSEFVLQAFVALHQFVIGAYHVFGKLRGLSGDAGHGGKVGTRPDALGGWYVETGRQVGAIDHGVVADDAAIANGAVEQDAVEADEDVVADHARAMHDGAMGNGGVFADIDQGAGFGVDDDPVLDIGMGADADRFEVAVGIDLIGTDDGVGTDEDVFLDDDLAADDGGLVDVGGFVNLRQVAARVLADHGSDSGGIGESFAAFELVEQLGIGPVAADGRGKFDVAQCDRAHARVGDILAETLGVAGFGFMDDD